VSGYRSYLGEALPLPPPKPPRPPTLVGPDRWWNPFSPAWPPTALGRAAADAARKKSAEVANDVEQRLEQRVAELQENTPGIDPIVVAETIVGKPTWGYYVPTVAVGLGSAAAILGVGALVYRARSKRRKK
jgi:hypothetical protein